MPLSFCIEEEEGGEGDDADILEGKSI